MKTNLKKYIAALVFFHFCSHHVAIVSWIKEITPIKKQKVHGGIMLLM